MKDRDPKRSISMIEEDMARSRAEINRTTEALKSKMEPENLGDAARQVIKDSTSRIEEKVKNLGLADTVEAKVEDLGHHAVSYFQQNPIPALIAGVGMSLLIALAERETSPRPLLTSPTTGEVEPSRLNQTLAKHPRLLQAQRRTVRRARRANRQHPLMLGAAIFGTGLLLGTLLPTTQREDELLGPVRDSLLESGKESAEQALSQAKIVVEQELEKRKEDVGELAASAEEAALQAYREARDKV